MYTTLPVREEVRTGASVQSMRAFLQRRRKGKKKKRKNYLRPLIGFVLLSLV